jgi:hypothetical protein
MSLTNSKELMLSDTPVTVRELTVLQVRNWLSEAEQPKARDVVSEALFSDCSLGDLQRMTSLTAGQIDALRPSQIREVIALCKELNPDFFGLRALLVRAPAAA